jgi:hypothetical protein
MVWKRPTFVCFGLSTTTCAMGVVNEREGIDCSSFLQEQLEFECRSRSARFGFSDGLRRTWPGIHGRGENNHHSNFFSLAVISIIFSLASIFISSDVRQLCKPYAMGVRLVLTPVCRVTQRLVRLVAHTVGDFCAQMLSQSPTKAVGGKPCLMLVEINYLDANAGRTAGSRP